jgi:negative regulator of sigma E activity
MANTQITEKQVDEIILKLMKKHSKDVVVKVEKFHDLLKYSLSLSTMEKKRVVDAVPTLSQFQFDELTKVFEDERIKFKELAGKHPEDIKKLVAKQQKEWIELGDIYKLEEEKAKAESGNQAKIDDVKKSLGL